MNKLYIVLLFSLLSVSTVSACGWFTYEDIEDTRAYYNIFDDLEGVEDSTLLMSRYPQSLEIKKNVFIPGSFEWQS